MKAKSTAQLTTLARAVANLESDPRLRTSDDLAVRFLDPALAKIVHFSLLRRLAIRLYQRWLPGAYLYTIARTKHIDAVLRAELEQGTKQVVILGAGYDSRAYRFHDDFPGARFFEVDYPATSARKLERVTVLFGCPPVYVSYVAADLTVDKLNIALLNSSYDRTRRTLFICEGVTMYLTAAAVDETLAGISRDAGRGSSIVFDYVFHSVLEGDKSLYGAAEAIRLVRKRGEPFLFGINAGKLVHFLRDRGLECVAELNPVDIERIYLTREDDSLIGRSVGYWALIHARRLQ
jgi:methyltransferase (TIGR00027 family)